MANLPLKEKSLLFAPMEGVTDGDYRKTIEELYPEWDMLACDFLRISSVGDYPDKHVIKHYGMESYEDPVLRAKTIYQILTSTNAHTEFAVKQIDRLGFKWLDLNLGCPSKTVCKNKGGSYLLSNLKELEPMLRTIRDNFPHTFTCKIRVGYEDDQNFEQIIELLNKVGVDGIIIHARTRKEMYKGVANWNYVKRAVELSSVPIIGNGDIWSVKDINQYYKEIGCHSIMLARPALKSPWLARHFKEQKLEITEAENKALIIEYFQRLYQNTHKKLKDEYAQGRRLKSVSRYIFDDIEGGDLIKRKFLLSKTPDEMFKVLNEQM